MKPLIVALCGRPTSGKSTIQNILHEEFGLIPFDDGDVLRRHCMELFDVTREDVSTQEGKLRTTQIQGVNWENRKIVGEYGDALETTFGELTVPNWAIKAALKDWEGRQRALENSGLKWRSLKGTPEVSGYSFGSVRRNQGKAYRNSGGIVVEIQRKGVAPTGNIWDEYSGDFIDHTFHNDMPLADIKRDFCTFFEKVLDHHNGHKKVA